MWRRLAGFGLYFGWGTRQSSRNSRVLCEREGLIPPGKNARCEELKNFFGGFKTVRKFAFLGVFFPNKSTKNVEKNSSDLPPPRIQKTTHLVLKVSTPHNQVPGADHPQTGQSRSRRVTGLCDAWGSAGALWAVYPANAICLGWLCKRSSLPAPP